MKPERIEGRASNNPLAQALGVVGGLLVVGAAFFLGLVFLAIFLGLFVIAGTAIAARVWWLKRKLTGRAGSQPDRRQDSNVLEGEYEVIDQDTERSAGDDRH